MQTKTVLVVDDDDSVRLITEKLLSHAGYHVLLASSGREALEAFEKNACDAILIDFMLPEISGVEVAKTMREKNTTIPLFAVTGKTMEAVEKESPDAKEIFTEFFLKPFEFSTLIETLKKHIH